MKNRYTDRDQRARTHVPPALLGSLLEETLDPPTRDRVQVHVQDCPRCLATYGELARIAVSSGTGVGLEAAPESWVTQTKALASPPRAPRRGFPRGLAAVTLAAAAMGFVLIPLLSRSPEFRVPASVEQQLQRSSDWVFVSGQPQELTFRSSGTLVPGVEADLGTMAREYDTVIEQGNTPSPAFAAALINGYLAVGNLESARVRLRDAKARIPEDADLLQAEAAVAYRESRLVEARALLERVLTLDAGNAIAARNAALVEQELTGER